MPSTVQFHRVLRATPERVYRAFLDADAMVKWLPPNGFTGRVHHADVRVGGTYKMSFTNFTSGKSHSFGGEYLELVPNERIRWTDCFDDPNLPGEMVVTVTLKKVLVGTEVNIVQAGLPDVIPPEACTLGWQMLALLAKLVEAEIPDQDECPPSGGPSSTQGTSANAISDRPPCPPGVAGTNSLQASANPSRHGTMAGISDDMCCR